MPSYEQIVKNAWERTCKNYEQGKFNPELEEDLQCFLYHECLSQLQDATQIHAKVSRGIKGKKGEWIFPDLSLGKDDVVVEIKFVGKDFKSPQASTRKQSAIDSLEVMSTHPWYKKRKRFMLFFDEKKHFWLHDRKEIMKAGPGIDILFYPGEAPELLPSGKTVFPKGWN